MLGSCLDSDVGLVSVGQLDSIEASLGNFLMDIVSIMLFVAGCALLVFGAEVLVNHASALARAVGISPLIVGLTVVSYGTSAPELAVAIQASYAGQADIAVGNVVGSNISNILLILGVSATFTPLMVSRQLVRLEVPLMILVSFAMLWMGMDGLINRWDGTILFVGAIIYTGFVLQQSRREKAQRREAALEANVDLEEDDQTLKGHLIHIAMVLVGIALLVLGSRSLINGAIQIAEWLGISELIIGLTIVAVGTSLPELATSIIACLRGEKDIAVGNAIGSNIFNLLFVLGACGLIAPDGILVSVPALRFDIPVMIAVAIACLPIFFTGFIISRWEGLLFLAYYVAYTSYLVLNTTQHDTVEMFSTAMIVFVALMTLVAIMFLVMRLIRRLKILARRRRKLNDRNDRIEADVHRK